MYKEIIDTRLIIKIGEYGIIRSKEELMLDNGKPLGAEVWYDVCLDHGDGDIVASFEDVNKAKQWAKENM